MFKMARSDGLLFLILFTSLSWSGSIQAGELETVTKILARESAPVGVVFEMVGGDADSLNIALRRTEAYVTKLRKRFPDANYVIVTHGLEQFSLLEHNKSDFPELHQRVDNMVKKQNIPIHACGTLAEMSGVDTKDFINSVQVADSGPQQIQDYVEKGYILVEMELH